LCEHVSLPQDEIENMVREAEAHAETDKINRERVEAINQAEVRSALLKGLVSRELAPL
jgi:molecular chaperone DnaK (HSP70)